MTAEMLRHKKRSLWFGLASLLLLSSAASADNPYAGMDKDEAGLWYIMDKAEKQIKTSGARIKDAELNAYVRSLTCEVIGPGCNDLRIYVVNSPEFNASMAPNGMMIVNSGLILRAENAAQFACVLGHEYAHFTEGHSLKSWRSIKNLGNASLFLPIAGTLVGLAVLGEFSREQESDSDRIGMEYLARSGYSASECAQVWRNLIAEQTASTFKKTRKRGASKTDGIFSSHPVAHKRMEVLDELAKSVEQHGKTGETVHRNAINKFVPRWMESELLAKDYDRHIFLFTRLAKVNGYEGAANYYIGEAYRKRRKDGDKQRAAEHWLKASAYGNAPPQTWRALAEQARRKKQTQQALNHYRTYLAKAPNAGDAALIQSYISRLSNGAKK